jgi:hypothetical protein
MNVHCLYRIQVGYISVGTVNAGGLSIVNSNGMMSKNIAWSANPSLT